MKLIVHNFTPNGLQKAQPLNELPIGMKVYAYGAFGSESIYCITGPMTKRGQEMCLISRWSPNAYFASPKNYLDTYSKPVSKKFGIGFYWDDVDNHIFPESRVKAAIRRAEWIERKIAKMNEEKRQAEQNELAELPGRYPHLTPIPNDCKDWYRAVKANIVAELKHHFPEHKFSVNKDGDRSIRISWYDGLVSEKVDDVMRKFESHKSDVTGDYWDFLPTCFNTVFGGMKFVFINRYMSEEVKKLTKQVKEILPDRYKAVDQQLLREYWSETDFPFNATNIRVVENPDAKGVDELFTFQYDMPEKLTSVASPEGIQVVEYSPKSFAVIGDTKPLKDKLKALGGKFNFRLTCGAGWIFPNTLKENVLEALQL